jgi:hypothetical protein
LVSLLLALKVIQDLAALLVPMALQELMGLSEEQVQLGLKVIQVFKELQAPQEAIQARLGLKV